MSFPALLAQHSYQIRTVDVALKQFGITRTATILPHAVRAAAGVYGMDDWVWPYMRQPKWVLGLDYSRSALVISVDVGDRRAFEHVEFKFRTDLGQSSAWDLHLNP